MCHSCSNVFRPDKNQNSDSEQKVWTPLWILLSLPRHDPVRFGLDSTAEMLMGCGDQLHFFFFTRLKLETSLWRSSSIEPTDARGMRKSLCARTDKAPHTCAAEGERKKKDSTGRRGTQLRPRDFLWINRIYWKKHAGRIRSRARNSIYFGFGLILSCLSAVFQHLGTNVSMLTLILFLLV